MYNLVMNSFTITMIHVQIRSVSLRQAAIRKTHKVYSDCIEVAHGARFELATAMIILRLGDLNMGIGMRCLYVAFRMGVSPIAGWFRMEKPYQNR